MKYYYTLDSENYIVNWSVGASFAGSTELDSSVVVPDDLKTCSCNAKCYKLENGAFTFDNDKAATCETECEENNNKYCPATKEDLNSKQDKLTAGTNITISDNVISAKDTTYSEASTTAAGLMSVSDKTKLNDSITSSQITSIEVVTEYPTTEVSGVLYIKTGE